MPLAGFETRTEQFADVADHLEINAVLLRQGSAAALILSADVLYVGDRLESALRQRLERAELADCLILAGASHTHFAPNVDTRKPRLGACDEQFCERYVRKAAELVDRLLVGPAKPARVRYAAGTARHSVNRRRRVWRLDGLLPRKSILPRANPNGPNDPALHLVRFEDEHGTPQALIWSYACHPVAFPHPLHVTAEFPGVTRRELRARHGADLPVLFLQGFSGDLRPPAITEPGRNPRRRLAATVQGPALGRFSQSAYLSWSQSLSRLVEELSSSSALREIAPSLRHRAASLPLSTLIDGDTDQLGLGMIQLQLSADLQLFALTAEPVVEYADRLRSLFPAVQTIPIGCAGSVYGYLPTRRMVDEGGYEAVEFFEAFSLRGRFKPSLEHDVVELMRSFAR